MCCHAATPLVLLNQEEYRREEIYLANADRSTILHLKQELQPVDGRSDGSAKSSGETTREQQL